uniref:Uncharacterized protein n=1 Tax=Romanomermis culicivorax TaxID=13658 RepID=A0A915J1Y1_ROMCU
MVMFKLSSDCEEIFRQFKSKCVNNAILLNSFNKHTIIIRSSTPLTPLGILSKTAWSLPVVCNCPAANESIKWAAVDESSLNGGDMTWAAACRKQ